MPRVHERSNQTDKYMDLCVNCNVPYMRESQLLIGESKMLCSEFVER